MSVDSEQLALFLNADYVGENRWVDDVESLSRASEADLTYCTQYDTDEEIANSDAGVMITPESVTDHQISTVIPVPDPMEAFVKAADEFFAPESETNIHPTAVIHEEADIGDRCTIGANVYIGENVTVGSDCVIHAGTSIGTDALMFARDESGKMTKHIQTGEVIIKDDVEIGANCTVDRSIFKETVIGEGTKIDNLVHIAHDCRIGKHVTIPAGCTFSGHVTIGDKVRLNTEVAIGVYVTVGEGAEIGANSTVLDDVEPYTKVVGSPAKVVGSSRFAD